MSKLPRERGVDRLANQGGLIAAYRLHGNGSGTSLAWDVLENDPLGSNEPGDIWIHLDRTAPRAQTWLHESARIPHAARIALLSEDPRPRLIEFAAGDDHIAGLVLLLRGINFNEHDEPSDLVSIRVWIDADRAISLSRRTVASVRAIRKKLLRGNGPIDSTDFVHHLADALTERVRTMLESLDDRLDSAEARLVEGDELQGLRTDLSEIRRVAIRLRRYMIPQRDALADLARGASELLTHHQRMLLFQSADHAARVVDAIEEIRARATSAQEELRTATAEQAARSSAKLTAVATIFLPLGLIAGVWGMNVRDLPWAETPHGFWVLLGVMTLAAGSTAALARVLLGKS